MKKVLIALIALTAVAFCKAQNVSTFTLQTNCPITITAPTDSALIFGAASITGDTILSYSWKQTSGPSTVVFATPNSNQTVVRKMIPGAYTFSMTVATKKGNLQTIINDQITVNPAPVPPRTVKAISWTLVNGSWIPSITYSDGTTQ